MILGGTMSKNNANLGSNPSGFILFPLVVHSLDLIASAIGILSISPKANPANRERVEDPMAVLKQVE